MKAILTTVCATMIISGTCFASPINTVASDELVQKMVSSLAAQGPSGDPVYCSFNKPTEVELKDTENGLQYQVRFDCGPGTQKNHMNNLKVFVKGTIEDSQLYIDAIQVGKQL